MFYRVAGPVTTPAGDFLSRGDVRAEGFFEGATQAFEILGVLSMVVGFLVSFALALITWKRTGDGGRAFKTLRESLGGAILLGLELLVAADIVKTVTSTPSLTDAAVLGMIVLIRTVLSFTIEVEIDGVTPWRKALTTGPEVMAKAARKATRSEPDPAA
jgi:uncharacterized membrane protein